jgi:hypothetical protein
MDMFTLAVKTIAFSVSLWWLLEFVMECDVKKHKAMTLVLILTSLTIALFYAKCKYHPHKKNVKRK